VCTERCSIEISDRHAQHPSNVLNFLVQLFVYHLATWYKFMMDNAFPIKKHNQHHWQNDQWFFWSRRLFPHTLWRLHLGFNILPLNVLFISCCDVLKKVFITICIDKQFLTDFTRFSFCSSVNKRDTYSALTRGIWSFSVEICWQAPMLMPTSSATSRTLKRRFPRNTARTVSTWSLFVDVEFVQARDHHRPIFCTD
jgi:hypothetical protein